MGIGNVGITDDELVNWFRGNAERAINKVKMFLISNAFRRTAVRKKRAREGLPLLLPSSWPPPTQERMEVIDSIMELFREMSSEALILLHSVQKNISFWRVRDQGSDAMKIRFMVIERGPNAFVQGLMCMARSWVTDGSLTQDVVYDAACRISERLTMLMHLQRQLASLLAQVYKEVDKLGDDEIQSREALCKALAAIYKALRSIEDIYELPVNENYGIGDASKARLQFEDLPEDLLRKFEWNDAEIEVVVNVLYTNLESLKDFMTFIISQYARPNKMTRHWIRNTGSAVGIILVTGWLVKHSRLAGSNDLENWAKQGADAVKEFFKEHVEEPLLSIRDDLFETFRKRHQGTAELGDVKLTAESLSRMLKAFAEQTTGKPLPQNVSEHEMMEIMMSRYEKELTHPLQSLLGGELARALLIQVQKLKLDIETAMLELNQILRANEINFAILAAFPAFIFALFLGYLIQISLSKGKSAEGRGRAAQLRRRMLVAEAEKAVMHYQMHHNNGKEEEALWQYGMVIYILDRLYRAVSNNGISYFEWLSLREDILDLAKPSLSTEYKLVITARMARIYECLVPVPKLR